MVKFDSKINKRADLHDFRPYELSKFSPCDWMQYLAQCGVNNLIFWFLLSELMTSERQLQNVRNITDLGKLRLGHFRILKEKVKFK